MSVACGNMRVLFAYDDAAPQDMRCIIDNEDGTKSSKTVPFDEFLNIIKGVAGRTYLKVGETPAGFLGGHVSTDGKVLSAVIRLPGGVRDFLYKGESYTIPMPNLVFRFVAEDGYIHRSFCAVEFADELYHYPFGNVYHDGHICFGNVTNENIRTFKDFEKVITAFVYAETNNDLFEQVEVKVKKKYLPLDQRQLLEFLKGKKEWPKENIKLKSFSGTIKDLLDLPADK